MDLSFSSSISREEVFEQVGAYLQQQNFRIASQDHNRPWGGFFVIDEAQSRQFIDRYFSHLTEDDLNISGKLSPKILVVAPEKRLSWQYHHRRAEIWKLIGGVAAVITSNDDEEKDIRNLLPGDIVELQQGERHRLIGLDGWGIVAEIWRHTNADQPSDENDIVRVQDDFGR